MSTICRYISLFVVLTVFLVSLIWGEPVLALEIHKEISGPFASIADVTRVCLKCHTEQAHEVLESTHWTWTRQRNVNGKNLLFGMKNSLAEFAIDVASNPERCMGCHVSITRPEVNMKTPTPEMVDCLVCHDTTGTYRQIGIRGLSSANPDQFATMARNVGIPHPQNCTTCHFADCGLSGKQRSSVEFDKTAQIPDVHLNNAATPFTCQKCHGRRSGHNFSRAILTNDLTDQTNEEGCASCHTSSPHTLEKLNAHGNIIACRTCHIPEYARQKPILFNWNWMMNGMSDRVFQKIQGNRTLLQDENGFTSVENIEPIYLWDDGTDKLYTRGQRIHPEEITFLQQPSEKSATAKIAPFRITYGNQLYDAKYRYLVSPLLKPEGTIFFQQADWENIARQGMEAIVLPFSGEYGFTTTVRYQRLNHGITPAAKALGCVDCHGAMSRMPWKDLGYESDPWHQDKPVESDASKDNKINPLKTGIPGYSRLSRR